MAKVNKEIKNIKQVKLVDRPMGAKNRLAFIQEHIYRNIKDGEYRFNKLCSALDNAFPLNTADRGFVDASLAIMFDTTLELLFLGKNASLLIELQGVLERFCSNALRDILPIDTNASQKVISQMLDKKTLKETAPFMETLGIWDNEDVKIADRLTKIRNGIAHKNAEIVSKYLGDGQQRHYASIDSITEKVDCVPWIIDVFKLIVKVSHIITSPVIKNPRLHARYNRYSSSIGPLACLFCIPDFMTMPKDLKDLHFIDFFTPLSLISTEELGAKLREYHVKVVEFHDMIGVDDQRANELHTQLCDLFHEIFNLMRSELKIDFDRDILVAKPNNITLEEIRQIKSK